MYDAFVSGRTGSEGVLVRRKGMSLYKGNFVALTLKVWLAVGDRMSLITRNQISYILFSSFS